MQVLPLTKGAGSAPLPVFVPSGKRLYVEVACSGPGAVQVLQVMTVQPCTGTGIFTNAIDGYTGIKLSLSVKASPATRWEVLATSG
jgi:hypothetical protein